MPKSNQALTLPRGRPPATTRDEVARIALKRFVSSGFDETTVDQIAEELRIGRRTLFRYFASKNDIVWGDFDGVLGRLRAELAARSHASLVDALREAVVASNTYPDEVLPDLRIRMTLITSVPTLQAHSMLRYTEWREVVAQFAAGRLGQTAEDFTPVTIGFAALAASTSAFVHWVAHPEGDLLELLRDSYERLADGFRTL